MASSSAAIGLSHWSFSDRIASTLTGKSHEKDSANSTVPADVGTVEVAGRGGIASLRWNNRAARVLRITYWSAYSGCLTICSETWPKSADE